MKWLSALAAVATFMACGGEARAFECTRSSARCVTSVHWEARHIPYVIRRDVRARHDDATIVAAVEEAFGRWEDVACSDLTFSLEAVLDHDTPHSTQNEVVFLSRWDGRNAAAGAITELTFGENLGVIRSAVIRVNASATTVDPERCDGELDLVAVLTHEVGHFVGIAHPCEYVEDIDEGDVCPVELCEDVLHRVATASTSTAMWPRQGYCDPESGVLQSEDVQALCFVYPRAQEPRQCAKIETSGGVSLVSNEAFGCRTSNAPASLTVLLLMFLVRLRARRTYVGARRAIPTSHLENPLPEKEKSNVSFTDPTHALDPFRARRLRW